MTAHLTPRPSRHFRYDARRDIEHARHSPERFWLDLAHEFTWAQLPTRALHWKKPRFTWFEDGFTNITLNALDRHARGANRNKAAFIWLGENGEERTVTYGMLHERVSRLAGGLRALGVQRGDRVVIYMPLTLEGVMSMLACARLGAVHSVVYAGLGVSALRERIQDAGAKIVITGDIGHRRGKTVDLYDIAEQAVRDLTDVQHLVVYQRGADRAWDERTVMLEKLFGHAPVPAEIVSAEHPLFILYTSGSTGKPKGVTHVHGGYMVGTAYFLRAFFDVDERDVFFCTSDIGWVVGHSYIVYGPLVSGATTVFREGAPDYPDPGAWWRAIERYGVNVLFTAPTALRYFMKLGSSVLEPYDLSSLRVLACAGEPLNPEAWRWAQEHICGGLGSDAHGLVLDNWWQTELGAPTLGTLAQWEAKPGFVGRPLTGVDADIVDENGQSVPAGEQGLLVIRTPLPSMLRDVHGNRERYERMWTENPAGYLTGDIAMRDEQGYISILGRADDILNVAGHRIGTADVESALVSHPAIAEAAVIGVPDELRGECIHAHVILRAGREPSDTLKREVTEHVRRELGPIAAPSHLEFVPALPKTRSGKIMRRVLRAWALGQDPGDLTTLEG